MDEKYAVVRECGVMKFTKWHETEEEARKEAERLCRTLHDSFMVIKSVGHCRVPEIPVAWD